jgi:hypothetical protein
MDTGLKWIPGILTEVMTADQERKVKRFNSTFVNGVINLMVLRVNSM